MNKDTSAALHGSPPLSVAAKRSSEDADRSVRRTRQMPDELRRHIESKRDEARHEKEFWLRMDLWNNAVREEGKQAALDELLEAYPLEPPPASGAANSESPS